MLYRIRRFFPIIWKNMIPRFERFMADTAVIDDAGCRRVTGRYCANMGYRRVLVVTDKNIMKSGLVFDVLKSLEAEGIEYDVFDGVTTDIRYSTISAATFVGSRIHADCVVAMGGGSSLDCGKLTACALSAGWLPMSVLNTWLIGPMFGHRPLISIPTTAGSGSEASVSASVTCNDTHIKHLAGGPGLGSELALLDVETLMDCPAEIIAYCGIDALSHGLEAYLSGCARTQSQKTEAARCVRICMSDLYRAYSEPDNDVAKKNMLIAANCGGRVHNWCFGGYNQAFAYAVGMTYYIHHGKAVAATMVANLEWLRQIRENEIADLAVYTGIGDAGWSASENADIFISAVEKLIADTGLSKYSELIKAEDYGIIIDNAFKDSINYPLPKVMTEEEAVRFLNRCSGSLDVDPADVTVKENPLAKMKPNADNRDLLMTGAAVLLGLGLSAAAVHRLMKAKHRR